MEFFPRDFVREPEGKNRIMLSIEDEPAFVFTPRQPSLARLRIVGVDLYRKALAGEYIFDEKPLLLWGIEPYFARALIFARRKVRRKLCATPWLGNISGPELHQTSLKILVDAAKARQSLYFGVGPEKRSGHPPIRFLAVDAELDQRARRSEVG
jgi:hypothetical protein